MPDDIFATATSIAEQMPSENVTMGNGANPEAPIPKDRKGNRFDPSIHVTGPDGKPILLKDGSIKQKPGRRVGSVSQLPTGTPQTAAEAKATGAAIAESIFMLCRGIGGEVFTPIQRDGIDERAMMIDAWQRYCEAKGITEVPPSMFIGIAMLNYLAPRFTIPTVRERVKVGFMRIREWWKRKRGGPQESKE